MSPEAFAKTFNVSRETISRLQIYHDLLVKWQGAINLVSQKTIDDIWNRHFADSAQLEKIIPQNAVMADLGSGAGFPGMVLAIMRSDTNVSLIESDFRKAEFLKNVSRETKTAVTIFNDRVEKILGQAVIPEIITARAFAPLKEILEMVPENCRKAELVLLKGRQGLEEIEQAKSDFNFDFEDIPSLTEPEAHILKIRFS